MSDTSEVAFSLLVSAQRARQTRTAAAARLLVACILVVYQGAQGASFTAGNVVVLIPQGISSSNSATSISLSEYTPAGTIVQTISVPGNCMLSPAATTEGKLKSSFDGSRISWGCFACASGTASVATVRRFVTRRQVTFAPPSPPPPADLWHRLPSGSLVRWPDGRRRCHLIARVVRLLWQGHTLGSDDQCGRGLCRRWGSHIDPLHRLHSCRRGGVYNPAVRLVEPPRRLDLQQHALLHGRARRLHARLAGGRVDCDGPGVDRRDCHGHLPQLVAVDLCVSEPLSLVGVRRRHVHVLRSVEAERDAGSGQLLHR